jgi:hypothetical protein
MNVTREQLAKVRTPFRILAGFIFTLSMLTLVFVIFIAIVEPYDNFIWVISLITLAMSYISGHVTFTGYAPNFLLFTHGAKNGL